MCATAAKFISTDFVNNFPFFRRCLFAAFRFRPSAAVQLRFDGASASVARTLSGFTSSLQRCSSAAKEAAAGKTNAIRALILRSPPSERSLSASGARRKSANVALPSIRASPKARALRLELTGQCQWRDARPGSHRPGEGERQHIHLAQFAFKTEMCGRGERKISHINVYVYKKATANGSTKHRNVFLRRLGSLLYVHVFILLSKG